MKKIIYSEYTKITIVVLFIMSVVSAALSAVWGVGRYTEEDENVYAFESDFSQSNHFSYKVMELESKVCDIIESDSPGVILEKIDTNLVYYIKINDEVYTNTDDENFSKRRFYNFVSCDEYGNITRDTSLRDYNHYFNIYDLENPSKKGEITIKTAVDESYVKKCEEIWERQGNIVNKSIMFILISIIFGILFFICIVSVCGKTADGEVKIMWIDRIWTEIHFAVILIAGILGTVGAGLLVCVYYEGYMGYKIISVSVGLVAAAASAVILCSVLSVIRNIKAGKFAERTVFYKIIRWIYGRIADLKCSVQSVVTQKLGKILIGIFFAYTAVTAILCGLAADNALFSIPVLFLFGFVLFLLTQRIKDMEEIKKGVEEIGNGNTQYKIPKLKSDDMNELAQSINDISRGLSEAVSERVRAEKMKAELITNVSHDLKTPLTSVINYTELLKKVENMPEEAMDYINIIENKGEKLKKLTQDLFDISKAQSGNEKINLEKLDVSLLIEQSLGENNGEITKSGLTFCVNAEKISLFMPTAEKCRVLRGIL